MNSLCWVRHQPEHPWSPRVSSDRHSRGWDEVCLLTGAWFGKKTERACGDTLHQPESPSLLCTFVGIGEDTGDAVVKACSKGLVSR